MRNKGLAPHRTGHKYRNPRVKKKIKYAKAVVRRKGQVREMRREAGGHGRACRACAGASARAGGLARVA